VIAMQLPPCFRGRCAQILGACVFSREKHVTTLRTRLLEVRNATLFETLHLSDQMRLFDLTETLGEEGWLKVLKLEEYAPRRPLRPEMLQQVLFAYTDAAV
jgi:hypothetical protein